MKHLLHPVYPPLFPVVLSLITGIIAGHARPDLPVWVLFSLLFLSLFLLHTYIHHFSSLVFTCCALAIFWGSFSMVQLVNPDFSSNHLSQFANGNHYIITGRIVSFTRHYSHADRLILECHTLDRKGVPLIKTKGRISFTRYKTRGKTGQVLLQYGDIIQFNSRLRPIRNFSNPHGYDYEEHMRFKGIFGSAYAKAHTIHILPQTSLSFLASALGGVERIRNQFYNFILSMASGNESSHGPQILSALVTGKKENLDPELRDTFSRAGASHILAISGLHLSIIALGFYAMFYGVLARFHYLAISGKAKKAAGLLTLIPLFFYALFAGFSPSAQRAFIMIMVFMTAFLIEKEKDPMNTLCLAAIIILVMDSSALFSISFQLSFAALSFIILGFMAVYSFLNWPKNPLLSYVAGSILVTVFAGLGTFPLIAQYFNLVSYVQILSNLVLVPLMGFICLPLGFVSLVLFFCYPPLAAWVAGIAIDILGGCVGYIQFLTDPGFTWSRIVTPSPLDILLIYLFMAACLLFFYRKKKWASILLGLVLITGSISVGQSIKSRLFPGKMSITILDVGQGNASLIHTPEGRTILIDGGGFSGFASFDVGRYVVAPFLWGEKIKTLDAVILTHPESDHMKGLVFIMENFKVKQWIKNLDTRDTESYTKLVYLSQTRQIPVWYPSPEDNTLVFNDTQLIFHAPDKANYTVGKNPAGNRNDNSLVCQLRFKEISILFPGDIGADREKALISKVNDGLKSTILLAPHHGSSRSSSKIFLDKIDPESVIVSCGYKNPYGFPREKILGRYKKRDLRVFRTDLDGAVTIGSDGRGYQITTNRR